jgi:repressor LexA
MESLEALKRLRKFFRKNKRLPSYSEMNVIFGFSSKKASFSLVEKLVKEGFLAKDYNGKLSPKKFFPALPVLGLIPAGSPIAAQEQLLETMSFDDYLVANPEKSYVLRVSGDSMQEAGINEGDLVVVEKDKTPLENDIVVACVDDNFTLKTFKKKKDKAYLKPANKKYPVIYPQNSLVIFGTVVSVIRKYH